MKSILTKSQFLTFSKPYRENGKETAGTIYCKIRYDDACGNGHNTFSITGHVQFPRERDWRMCGCIHEEIEKHFPEFRKLIKWHSMSSDSPMHYIANALYHASDRDCWGKRKGEVKSYRTKIFFDSVPIPYKGLSERFTLWLQEKKNFSDLTIVEFPYIERNGSNYKFSPKYSFNGYGNDWYTAEFDSKLEAEQFLEALKKCSVTFQKFPDSWGEGKEPDLEAARNCAIWPDAKLEDFTKENLEKRLPKLLEEFKKDIEELGLIF